MNYVNLKSSSKHKKYGGAKSSGKSVLVYLPLLAFFIILVFSLLNLSRIKDVLAGAFNPVVVSAVTGGESGKLKDTDGRTNILLLGSDQRTYGSQLYSQLTDTIIVISVGNIQKDVVIISIPRDLWVEASDGGRWKVNELYGIYGGREGSGTSEVIGAVEDVLGIPIHYYSMINFGLFEEVVDTLGGIDVNVETAFEDFEYPIEGREADTCGKSSSEISDMVASGYSYVQIFPCRYEHLVFETGVVHMDGEMALKFSRSRHGNNNEGTDFARAKRQQKVILAIKDKALSADTLFDLSKIKSLFDIYSQNVDTNLDISSIQLFYNFSKSASFSSIKTLVLDDRSAGEDGGLLYSPTDLTLYGNKYVLIPKAGDYSQIHAYIQKYLFD